MSEKSFSMTEMTAFQLWTLLDCPTSRYLADLARRGDWTAVLTHKVEPGNFTDALSYGKANAAVSFLKKNPFIRGSSSSDRKASALRSWREGEASCYMANERLSRHLVSPLSSDAPSVFLRRVRRRLISWLKLAPDDDELHRRSRHGPGTTFSSAVSNPTAADKYGDSLSLTSGACWYLASIVGTMWGAEQASRYRTSSRDCIEFVRGNRHAVVPKTALTDRNIGIEPTGNIYFQLGVGSSIRARMRKHAGWDLDNAAAIHRKMAASASVDGSFATLDLSNASDTLCKNLVRVLFRDTSWLPILEDLRSPMTRVDGKWHLLEKFSSMGNGYTFELESCVFAAICAECLLLRGHEAKLGHNLFVFGDDLIVPTDTADLVVSTLQWLGFEINKSKSFTAGPFRESCGADYFEGLPVRGYYLKHELSKADPSGWFAVHNGVRSLFERLGLDPGPFLKWILDRLPSRLRTIGGPSRLGDRVLHGIEPTFRWRHGIRWIRAVKWSESPLVSWAHFSPSVRLACRLTGYGDSRGVTPRGYRPVQEMEWVSDS